MGCIKSTAWQAFKHTGDIQASVDGSIEIEVLERLYKVEKQVLGAGSYAKVYKAVEIKTGQVVAVKRISKGISRPELLDSEITILRRFGNHRNIVRLFACYETETEVQLVMEYLPGGELFDVLDQNGPYGESDAARHVKAVASGLEYLHKNLVAHRDLKPENLLLTAKPPALGTLKISDFGLAKMLKPDEEITKAAGTWAYCAPEVLLVRRNDAGTYHLKCDMFSLGVLTFVILAGYHPFDPDGDRSEKVMQDAIIGGIWDFKDSAWDSVSDEAKNLITVLLESDPLERLSAKAAMAHPWTAGVSPYGSLSNSINEDIKSYRLRMRQKQLKAGLLATQSVFRMQALQGLREKSAAARRWDIVRAAFKSGELSHAAKLHKVVRIAHHRWLRTQNTPDLRENKRHSMIVKIFSALDFDKDGYLGEAEMFRFAQFKNFPGDRSKWKAEYESLCDECGWVVDLGVDFLSFELLLNTKECNFYSNLGSLEDLVYSLTGYKEENAFGERSSNVSSKVSTQESSGSIPKKKKQSVRQAPHSPTKKHMKAQDSVHKPARHTQSQSVQLSGHMTRGSTFQPTFHASRSQPLERKKRESRPDPTASTQPSHSPRPSQSVAKKGKPKQSPKPRAKVSNLPDQESPLRLVEHADENEESKSPPSPVNRKNKKKSEVLGV